MEIEYIFNGYKIKYDLLNKFNQLLKNKESISFFINIEPIFIKLHRKDYEEEYSTLTKNEKIDRTLQITSGILNIAAHYRKYFYNKKINTKFIFYYNDLEKYSNYYNNAYNHTNKYDSMYVPEPSYRMDYFLMYNNKSFRLSNQVVINALDLLKNIAEKIDGVYVVKSEKIESSLTPLLLADDKSLKSDLDVVISKDLYDLQYALYSFIIFYPNSSLSAIIAKSNLIDFLKFKFDVKSDRMINPHLYPFILSVLGDKKRNLDKVIGVGFKKIFKSLVKLYDNQYISDADRYSLSPENLCSLITENNGLFKTNIKEIISKNYNCIDLKRQKDAIVANSDILELKNQLIDSSVDPEALKEFNDKIFYNHPIELVELNNINAGSVFDLLDGRGEPNED